MIQEVIKRYDKILYDLFILMGVILIYLIICEKILIAIIFGLLLLFVYRVVKKEVRQIKELVKSQDND